MGKWTFMPPVQTLNLSIIFLSVFHLCLRPGTPPPPPRLCHPPSTSAPALHLHLRGSATCPPPPRSSPTPGAPPGPRAPRWCSAAARWWRRGADLLPAAGGGELVLCCRPLVVASWCSAAAHCWRRAAACTHPGVVPPHAQVLLPLKSSPLDRSCSSRSSQFCSPRFISSPSTRSASE